MPLFLRIKATLAKETKFIQAGPVASWLWLASVGHCREGSTDGFIPKAVVPGLVPGLKGAFKHAAALVDVGLWLDAVGGYIVNDYLDWNPSRAEIASLKQRDRDRKSNGTVVEFPEGIREESVGRLHTGARAGASSPSPDPDPDPDRQEGEESARETRPDPSELVVAWNTFTFAPIPRCRELSGSRRRKAISRLQERPLAEWRLVIQRIQGSAFCRGENDRGWIATFDWLLQPETALKTLEGKYDDREAVRPHQGKAAKNAAAWDDIADRLEAGRADTQERHATTERRPQVALDRPAGDRGR